MEFVSYSINHLWTICYSHQAKIIRFPTLFSQLIFQIQYWHWQYLTYVSLVTVFLSDYYMSGLLLNPFLLGNWVFLGCKLRYDTPPRISKEIKITSPSTSNRFASIIPPSIFQMDPNCTFWYLTWYTFPEIKVCRNEHFNK